MTPKIKRTLDIAKYVPDLQDGMAGAVEYGTARRLRANFNQLPVFGKTGTCSDNGTRFGWFASYSDTPRAAWSPSSSSRADAHLWPPRRRANRRVLQESLGQGLLCAEGYHRQRRPAGRCHTVP